MDVKNAVVYGYELLYWCKLKKMINYNSSLCEKKSSLDLFFTSSQHVVKKSK